MLTTLNIKIKQLIKNGEWESNRVFKAYKSFLQDEYIILPVKKVILRKYKTLAISVKETKLKKILTQTRTANTRWRIYDESNDDFSQIIILAIIDVKQKGCFQVFGTFTSSPQVQGKNTPLVSLNNRFDGQQKPQYLNEFENKSYKESDVEIVLPLHKKFKMTEYKPW